GDLTLYYGNPATRAPVYDLASLEPRLSLSKDFRAVHIGEEQANPRWAQAPPLAFATQMGARINTSEWRHMRVVAIARGDDLYTLSLTASDVSRLRPELGDLRVVSDDDRQVPYILALRAASERVPLQIQKVAASRTDARVSRYRLGFAAPIEAGAALPWESLEIAIREGFFSRPARLTVAGQSSRGRAQERVLYAGLIARKDTAETTIRLDLDGAPYSELFFEIDEGDNAPLTLQRAHAWVPVPRVAFKARAGEYRLLLGNDNARPPQYDLAALRGEVLAYSAVPITAQPLALNPTFRRRATDYFRKTPPALWLWVTLVSAVVVLLLLTVRILKQPLPPAPPEA
ncbi:MAG: hypothetical protein MUF51_12045, partial [Vicinamibacteria bacterium]|nr:hypothetical protein [Vicinamibacteria bacterium]